MNLSAWTDETAALLNAGDGVTAVSDPRDLSLPGVLVYPSSIEADRLDAGTYTVAWDVIVLASDAGTPAALDDLGALASAIDALALELSAWTVDAVTLPNLAATPLPALRATLTTECED